MYGVSQPIRLASYNVHGGVGSDGRYDPARIVDVLREIDADIIGLQEVDARHTPDRAIDQFVYFASEFAFHAVPGANIILPHRSYGNVLLSRWPVRNAHRIRLTTGRREPRGAISALIATPFGPLRVLTTHLGQWPRERWRQLAYLAEDIAKDPTAPLAILGDFNIWGVERLALRRLGAPLFGGVKATFPANRPLLALDRIWTWPHGMTSMLAVHRSPAARRASDHLPLVAAIEYPHMQSDPGSPAPPRGGTTAQWRGRGTLSLGNEPASAGDSLGSDWRSPS